MILRQNALSPFSVVFLGFLLLVSCAGIGPRNKPLDYSGPVIVDHKSAALSPIPEEAIEAVKSRVKWHYAHTSHGSQLLHGLRFIMKNEPEYAVSVGDRFLPKTKNALCVFNGQEKYRGVSPERYWRSKEGRKNTRSVLENNSTINITMWSWCGQAGTYSKEQVQEYLETMEVFQEAYPEVTFIYMTGHAQQGGKAGYNRYQRNNQIRRWVKNNPEKNRVLFDFADLDSWWYNNEARQWEQATYQYGHGRDRLAIPIEHPRHNGNEIAHTTPESCIKKGRAVWWMFSRLVGWNPGL